MEKKFTYAEKIKTGILIPLMLLGIIFLLVAFFKRDDLSIGNLVILAYPVSTYILSVFGLAMIATGLLFFLRARSIKESGREIIIYKDSFTYPLYTGIAAVTKEILFDDIDLLWAKNTNSKNESMILYTPANKGFQRFDCKSNYFQSKSQFIEFKKIITENCRNIKEEYLPLQG